MKENILSHAERTFAAECIKAHLRLDGRNPRQARKPSISLGPTWGFAEVLFDKTQAVASTTVEAITPPPDRAAEGTIAIAVELSATSSEPAARESLYRSASASVEMRNTIEGFVRESRAIDTEALCILAGVKVWSVRVDVDVINDDGNVTDVCMLAVMASLMHARRPDVTVTGKEVRIHTLDEREPVPLPVHHVPLSVTFSLFGAGKPYEADTVVLDPVKKEEVASNGSLTFAFNSQGEVCGVYKAGGLPLQRGTFAECTRAASDHVVMLTGTLKQALADVSAQHPLATVRPMLVEPEPIAMLKKRDTDREKADVPMSTWNATPAADDAPPVMEIENGRRLRDDTVREVFKKATKDDVMREEDEVVNENLTAKKDATLDEILESDSDSSDGELADAVISRPRGGGGLARKR